MEWCKACYQQFDGRTDDAREYDRMLRNGKSEIMGKIT